MVTFVVFCLLIVFPESEECTQTTSISTGQVTYNCKQKETKASIDTVLPLLVLLGYFMAKISCFTCFLHAFARKIVHD